VAVESRLIVQLPSGTAIDRQLSEEPPPSVASGAVALDRLPAGPDGRLRPPSVGEVVLSVPSPETLTREPEQVWRVIGQADEGAEPLVIVIDVAEELREDELAVVLGAAATTPRPVLLRVIIGTS
jgi:hypothetical protein